MWDGGVAKWLRRGIANPLFPGSNPGAASFYGLGVREAVYEDFRSAETNQPDILRA